MHRTILRIKSPRGSQTYMRIHTGFPLPRYSLSLKEASQVSIRSPVFSGSLLSSMAAPMNSPSSTAVESE